MNSLLVGTRLITKVKFSLLPLLSNFFLPKSPPPNELRSNFTPPNFFSPNELRSDFTAPKNLTANELRYDFTTPFFRRQKELQSNSIPSSISPPKELLLRYTIDFRGEIEALFQAKSKLFSSPKTTSFSTNQVLFRRQIPYFLN